MAPTDASRQHKRIFLINPLVDVGEQPPGMQSPPPSSPPPPSFCCKLLTLIGAIIIILKLQHQMFICPICKVTCDSLISCTKHMHSYHSTTHKVVVPCPFCPETMSQVRNWKRHILKIHANRITQRPIENNDLDVNNSNYSTSDELDIGFDSQRIVYENGVINNENPAKVNSTHLHPEYINDLNHEKKEKLNNVEERLRLNVLRLLINLKSNNATETCIDVCSKDLLNVLSEYKDVDTEIYFHNIRKTIETNTSREKFITSHLSVIQPKSIILGYSYVFHKKKQRQIRYLHKAQYIPFKESLIQLLKKPEVFETLNCRTRSTIMTDLSTGSFCEQHTLFRVPDSLKIILFYDDLGINNPLGSRATSIGMFYWTLANLPRFVRSQDRCVFLLACIEKKYLKQYGFTPVLNDFFQTIEEIQTDGLSITVDQQTHVFRGSLFLVCGDILGLAQMNGFKCAFRLGRKPFFYCDVNQEGLRRISKGGDCKLRTLEKYDKNCMAIDFANGSKKSKLQKKFGIISYSPLCKVRNFNIFQQTAIDIMHVLLEGICQRELKLLFKQIQREKIANLTTLSTMIRSFQYGSGESSPSNKFNLLSEESEVKFRLSASEMFTLIKYLPLIFQQAHLIQRIPTSSYWLSFLLLREIVSISFASEVDVTTIKQFEELVTRYLITFDNTYGFAQRLPKHHLLVHLGDQMDRFGPLRFTSCMIFEKKHSFFKKIKYRNFRNIAITLARRHQYHVASQMYSSNDTSTSSFLYSGHKIQKIKELHSSAAAQHHSLDPQQILYESSQVTLFGISYAVGDAVLINDYVFPADPVFGKILTIIVQNKIILLRLQLLQVISFNQQLCTYELRLLDCSITKNIYDLKHIWPMRTLKIDELFVVNLFPYGRSNLIPTQ